MAQVAGNSVNAIGFGLMGFTWRPQPPPLDQSIAALKAAVEAGVTLWNGAEFYGTPQYNSLTLLKAYFAKYPEDADKVTIMIKGGTDISNPRPDCSPANIRRSLDAIIEQLGGVKKLDVFLPARRDPSVPLEVTLEVIQKEYIDTGKLGGVGLSEVNAQSIHEGAKLAKIVACEVELSMFTPDILTNGVAKACAEHNIPIAAYSPIGRGMLTGTFKTAADLAGKGHLDHFPRFQGEAMQHNMKLVAQVSALAEKKGCTPGQLAINWVRSLSKRDGLGAIVPIPGSTTAARVQENAKIVELTEEEMDEIKAVVDGFETAGGRYPDGAPTNT